jgi:acyl carrier protein
MKPTANITEEELREFLAARLAEFKVPARVIVVSEIPRAATGKVQRSSLAKVFAEQLKKHHLSRPRTALETAVASIYAEVLGIESIGSHDNFFLLGGDSLHATQVVSRVRAAFQVNLPIASIFRKPTVAELSKEIVHVVAMSGSQSTAEKTNPDRQTLSRSAGPHNNSGPLCAAVISGAHARRRGVSEDETRQLQDEAS